MVVVQWVHWLWICLLWAGVSYGSNFTCTCVQKVHFWFSVFWWAECIIQLGLYMLYACGFTNFTYTFLHVLYVGGAYEKVNDMGAKLINMNTSTLTSPMAMLKHPLHQCHMPCPHNYVLLALWRHLCQSHDVTIGIFKSSKPCIFHIELYASVKSPVVNLAKLLPLYLRQPALTDMEVFFLFFFFSAIFADILFSLERKWGATLNRKLLGFLDNEANALNTKSCLPFALQL